MANIKVLNNKFIIEGHTSKEECDTLTQVANVLDKSKEFKTIEYKNGYAEFERVVNSEELKFVNDPMQTTFSWDAHISQISFYSMGGTGTSFTQLNTSTNSGDMVQYMGNTSASYTMTVNVVLEEGYVLDTITGENTTISNITNTTFDFAVLGNFTMPGNIVISSKVNNPNIQIPITKNGKTTLATKGTKNVEDIDINVDIAPTIQSLSITPSETSQTFNASNVDGYKPVNVSAIQTETPTVNLSLASGNQTVNASSGKYIKSLTITKPSTLIASNIKSGVNIAGVSGSLSPAKPEQAKIINITENGSQSVTPDSGKVLSSVEITTNVPTYITVASESALPSTAQEGTIAVVGGATDPITSTVSEFNASFLDNQNDTEVMQTTLGGGTGTYSATTDISDKVLVEVEGNTLKAGFMNLGSSSEPNVTGKITVTSNTASLEIPVTISQEFCLAEDTLITMADGSHKKIKDIKAGEYCLSLNEKGEKVPGYIYAIDSDRMKFGNHYDKFTFEDGTVLDIIHRHRFYNLVDNAFVHLDVWCEGDEGVNEQGKRVKLVKSQIRYEEKNIRHCTLFCENNTYFANGLLCGNRFSVKPDMEVFLNE